MTAVVLQPAGDPAAPHHYVGTIESPVPLSEILSFLSDKDQRILETLYPSKLIPTWGVTPGKVGQNTKKWVRLQVGDVTLFSRSGRIVSSGVMTHKVRSKELSEHLWKTKEDGSTWEYIYFLDEITPHDIPVTELNLIVGYKPNNVIQGFNVLDAEKSYAILENFDLASSIYFPPLRSRNSSMHSRVKRLLMNRPRLKEGKNRVFCATTYSAQTELVNVVFAENPIPLSFSLPRILRNMLNVL